MTHRVWWRGLPLWLKLVFLFVAIPAWLFIVFCIATGRDKSAEALAAFVIFAAVVLLNMVFDRRPGVITGEGKGIDFGGGGG